MAGSIDFFNTSKVNTASLYKLDDNNNEEYIADVAPESHSVQTTEDGDEWTIRAKAANHNGIELGSIIGSEEAQSFTINWPRDVPGQSDGGG